MKTLYGITHIQVYTTNDIDELNQFLIEYDGNIIDIKITAEGNTTVYHVIYKYRED